MKRISFAAFSLSEGIFEWAEHGPTWRQVLYVLVLVPFAMFPLALVFALAEICDVVLNDI